MQAWPYVDDPLGSLWLSSLIATIPIMFSFLDLAPPRLSSNGSGTLTVASGFLSLKPALKK